MSLNLLDHAYVVLVVGLVFPFGGWWAYRLFLERLERDGPAALVREYRSTMVWLLALGFGALGLWLAAGRPFARLGFARAAATAGLPSAWPSAPASRCFSVRWSPC